MQAFRKCMQNPTATEAVVIDQAAAALPGTQKNDVNGLNYKCSESKGIKEQ